MICIYHVVSLDFHHSQKKKSALTGCPPLHLWYGAEVLEVKSVRGQYSRLRARYDGWRKASKGLWVTADLLDT